MAITPETIGQGITALVVVATGVVNHFSGKKKDRRHAASLDEKFDALGRTIDARFNGVSLEITELRSHVIGPDGENGLRGDVREIKARVIGLEDRERDRLHGAYDRR